MGSLSPGPAEPLVAALELLTHAVAPRTLSGAACQSALAARPCAAAARGKAQFRPAAHNVGRSAPLAGRPQERSMALGWLRGGKASFLPTVDRLLRFGLDLLLGFSPLFTRGFPLLLGLGFRLRGGVDLGLLVGLLDRCAASSARSAAIWSGDLFGVCLPTSPAAPVEPCSGIVTSAGAAGCGAASGGGV